MTTPATWYMSFTFDTTPTNFPNILYLAFIINRPFGGSYGNISSWHNINSNCTINQQSSIYTYSPGGLQLTNTLKPYFVSYPSLKADDNTPFTKDILLQLNSSIPPISRVGVSAGTTYVYYNGVYVFSQTPFVTCCFSEGTNILSLTAHLREEYRLVQDLIVGDFVKTYLHGYRKVSRVISGNFVNNPKDEGVSNCMYRMKKTEDNPIGNYLTLTRNHGVLVEKLSENEEMKVDKNNRPVIDNLLSIITADSDKFEKVMDKNVYKYYHFSLETDGDEDRRFGVYANGILVEVPSNNMMDNALNLKPLDF